MQSLTTALQLILVLTDDWDNIGGRLYLFERDTIHAPWRILKPAIQVDVGKNGMAWGYGLHDPDHLQGNFKKEGDARSPAGIFSLGPVFGWSSETSHLKMPYIKITPDLEWVDDPASDYYNQNVGSFVHDRDWSSSEKMLEIGDLYEWGIHVGHNIDPVVKGKGSCIFMHVLHEYGKGTGGCTAMRKNDLEELILWLDQQKQPKLVQLPLEAYRQYQSQWHLPQIQEMIVKED
ncbi:MAG TPA: L,D-transpeptidase family protein [Rhabdochlamydiaceae bacterium]|nr:L,D-transpeptidase family protein [Rhabdochlamydiaceae bacterium]